MNKPFSLSKNDRIKSKKTIETLFQQGEAFFSFPYRIVFVKTSQATAPSLQMAISVPKRFFKRAHDRNRIKRLTKESYRLQKQTLQTLVFEQLDCLQVMFIYQGRDILDYQTIHRYVQQALQQLQKRLYPNLFKKLEG